MYFAASFDWFTGLSVSFVIGQSDYFCFGFATFSGKSLQYLPYVVHYRMVYLLCSLKGGTKSLSPSQRNEFEFHLSQKLSCALGNFHALSSNLNVLKFL